MPVLSESIHIMMMSIGTSDLQATLLRQSGVRCSLLCIYVANNVKGTHSCGEACPSLPHDTAAFSSVGPVVTMRKIVVKSNYGRIMRRRLRYGGRSGAIGFKWFGRLRLKLIGFRGG